MFRNLFDGPHIILLVLVIAILFGWKKLPDAARSLGRSMRIFKSEVEEMKKDGQSTPSAASRSTRLRTAEASVSRRGTAVPSHAKQMTGNSRSSARSSLLSRALSASLIVALSPLVGIVLPSCPARAFPAPGRYT